MVMVGTGGGGVTVTSVVSEVEVHPFADIPVTEYSPAVETTMLCVVSPLLHK
jgi:hypothetical protein